MTLCTSGRINKWSKHKPIRYDKVTPLTADERVGSPEDIAAGYYYGVRMCQRSGSLRNLHSMTFDYRGVRRGEDWSRLGDLDGYDRNAKPNPIGDIPDTAYTDIVGSVAAVCSIVYDKNNTTGIDLSEAIEKTTSEENAGLGRMYPCILLTIGEKFIVRALWDMDVAMGDMVGQSTAGVRT
ncbi:MAG: hypothetical protein K2J07_04220, partial [Muribaculaceae bacterium]|nr:hypothetical protein [Muribaculaceae bacterium]